MKVVILILIFCGMTLAQDQGYVRFEADEIWVIEINDTLITSQEALNLDAGEYLFSARPQISYSWPAIQVEAPIRIIAGDTVIYKLSMEKSTGALTSIDTDLPRTTSYKDIDYRPQSHQYPKLKTGLLLTAVAANWLAFYLKRQADDNYSKYERASGLSEINKYYDRAGNFDDASSVMLSISAAALSGYIYIAITE